jgi:triacylglycerol esterase/lipase EstA (alpha/beta hydrolase family)
MRRVLSIAAVLAALCATAAPAALAGDLPVRWDATVFLSGGQDPDHVPGANDFNCKPSAAHPNPVVLVHGLLATMGDNWATMSPLLKNNGFCVFALTYGRHDGMKYFGGLTQMQGSAVELDALVKRVLQSTGAQKIDLVGHSEGTVMPRWWMSFMGGAKLVDRYVMLTPLWDGTKLAGSDVLLAAGKSLSPDAEATFGAGFDAAGCGSCPQFVHGSQYLADVDKVGKALGDVRYTNIVTKYDELVIPYTSGILDAPRVKNFVLQDVCAKDYSEHAAVAYDPMAAQLMLNALDPAHARPVPCVDMTPAGASSSPAVGLAKDGDSGRERCTHGEPETVRVRPRDGERIERIVAYVGAKRIASRRGRARRAIEIRGLAPGTHRIRLRLVGAKHTRTIRRTVAVRCAR